MKRLLVSAAFLALWLMCSALHAVKITTGDGREFNYSPADIAALRQCATIDNLLNDLGDQEEVPLPGIDMPCLQRMLTCLRILVDDQVSGDKVTKKKLDEEIAQLTKGELCALLNGGDYLQAPSIILESALDRCIADPEFLLSATNKDYQLVPTVREMLNKRLASYLRKAGINNSQKPVIKQTLHQTLHLEDESHEQLSACSFAKVNEFIGGSRDGRIYIWDIVSGKLLHTIYVGTDEIQYVGKFKNKDKGYIVCETHHKLYFCDIDEKQRVLMFDKAVQDGCCIGESYVIVVNSSTGIASILDFPTERVTHTFHHPGMNKIDIAENGTLLATGAQDGSVKIWDVPSGALYKQLSNPHKKIRSLTWAPWDEDVLVIASRTKLYIWKVSTGILVRKFNYSYLSCAHKHLVFALNKNIYLVDSQSGEHLMVFKGHQDTVNQLDFSGDDLRADDNFLISVSEDSTARVWNIQTGQATHVLDHTSPVRHVFIFKDGNYFATITHDNNIYLWDFMASMQDLIDRSSLEQRLLLALGYQKHQVKRLLPLIGTSFLGHLFDTYTQEQQALIRQFLPIKRIQAPLTLQSLLMPAHESKSSVTRAAAGMLGLALNQKITNKK